MPGPYPQDGAGRHIGKASALFSAHGFLTEFEAWADHEDQLQAVPAGTSGVGGRGHRENRSGAPHGRARCGAIRSEGPPGTAPVRHCTRSLTTGFHLGCLTGVAGALGTVRPVESLRRDPDYYRSDRRRLLVVRFTGVSLFWRLDVDVRTESVAEGPHCDVRNPAARARDDEWSPAASALANAVGVIKVVARSRADEAHGLLNRGFARIDEDDGATGDWFGDVTRLARAAARHDSALADLAARVEELATQRAGRNPN